MHLYRTGDPSHNAVVLIHGIPGAASSWLEVADALSTDYRVLVPDLLGFGESPRPDDVLAEAQAIALERALVEERITHATIIGHDFGGPITLSLFRRRPDLFAAMGLMATNAFPDTPIPFPLSLVNLPGVGDSLARVLFSPLALSQMVRRYGGAHVGDPTTVRRIFTASLQNLDSLYGRYPETLRSVDVPTLVVWGDKDPFFPLPQAERTASLIPDHELRVLQDGGHFLPEERPVEVAAAIRTLLDRAESASPATH